MRKLKFKNYIKIRNLSNLKIFFLKICLILALWPISSFAVDLQSVQFAALGGNRVEIQLMFSAPMNQPESFSTESPARIALDLPGVTSKLERKTIAIGVGAVRNLVAVETEDRTRIVLNLAKSVPYTVNTEGNQIIIQINAHQDKPTVAADSSNLKTTEEAPPVVKAQRDIQTVTPWLQRAVQTSSNNKANGALRALDFHRGSSGEGRVIIQLPSAGTQVAVREEGTRVFVDIADTSLPKKLFRRLDVTDFATPVIAIEAKPKGRSVEVMIETKGDFDYMAYQTDDLFTLDLRPLTPAEKEKMAREKVVYEGDRLSLNFQDIEVRAVLQVLADFTNLNLIASDTVHGNITLRLKNVPWDQALDLILKTKGLAKRQTGNVLLIAPAQELAAQEQLDMESHQKIEELAPLHTEFIQINYAKASDIAEFIRGGSRGTKQTSQNSRRATGGSEGTKTTVISNQTKDSILSERGNVTFDTRTNTLVVMDTTAKLEEIRKIVLKLDVPVRQVMIESRIVIATNDFSRDLGVRFGVSGSVGSLHRNELLISGGQKGNLALTDYDAGPFGLSTDGKRYNSILSSGGGNNLITDLAVSDPSGSVNFLLGKVGSYLLQLELSAMQREGRGEVVSSTRVITGDQSPAAIKMGKEVPYQQATGQGNTNVTFKEAVLQSSVTPHITPDDRVILELEVNKDEPDFANSVLGVPSVNTRSVKTSVLVENGETVVLGGVFERTKSFNKEQVPWLGDLPVLGRLFKKEERKDNNSELLIFITPKILKSDLTVH